MGLMEGKDKQNKQTHGIEDKTKYCTQGYCPFEILYSSYLKISPLPNFLIKVYVTEIDISSYKIYYIHSLKEITKNLRYYLFLCIWTVSGFYLTACLVNLNLT